MRSRSCTLCSSVTVPEPANNTIIVLHIRRTLSSHSWGTKIIELVRQNISNAADEGHSLDKQHSSIKLVFAFGVCVWYPVPSTPTRYSFVFPPAEIDSCQHEEAREGCLQHYVFSCPRSLPTIPTKNVTHWDRHGIDQNRYDDSKLCASFSLLNSSFSQLNLG